MRFFAIACTLMTMYCPHTRFRVDERRECNMKSLFSTISNKRISAPDLLRAIRKLGRVTEPSTFWSNIANSPKYRTNHRLQCVYQLIRRHVKKGMKLCELATILDHPTWLTNDDIQIFTIVSGKVPVNWTFEDTVFVLIIFGAKEPMATHNGAIYFRTSGHIQLKNLVRILRGKPVAERTKNSRILELAIWKPDKKHQ
jgi:hypothetical protein